MSNAFQYIERRCKLRVEQLLLEDFCFEDNDAMIQFQCELNFPTAELTFWWLEVSWKPSSLAVTGGRPLEEKKLLFEHFCKDFSYKKQSVVFVDIPYVVGYRDVCGSWSKGLVWRTVLTP